MEKAQRRVYLYFHHPSCPGRRAGHRNADLQFKKHGTRKLIVVGFIAHTCVEATVRFAAELGYEVTMVKEAAADYSDEEMHAASPLISQTTPVRQEPTIEPGPERIGRCINGMRSASPMYF